MAKFIQFAGRHVNLDRVEVISVDTDREDLEIEKDKWAVIVRMPGFTCFEEFGTKDYALARSHELVARAS